MWFRNLQLFRFVKRFEHSPEALEDRLASLAFRPCGSLEMFTFGWVPPLGRHGTQLVHTAGGYLIVTARKEDKLLPISVVNEILVERVQEIETQETRSLRKREKQALRDEIFHDLLPRAFTRSALIQAYIAPREGWLVVDTASRSKAEELVSLLRQSLGTLPVVAPQTQQPPALIMTQWLTEQGAPPDFNVEDECELRDTRDGTSLVRCKGQDLGAEEVQGHLHAGKEVVKLALTWSDRFSFLLHDDLQIKRLRTLGLIQAQRDDTVTETEAERLDADFVLMTHELASFLPRLLDVFGGEDLDALKNARVDPAHGEGR
jgi:recombination associated protein RdgC